MNNKSNRGMLLCVFLLLILISSSNLNCADSINHHPIVIANIQSQRPIYFDVTADEGGDIHLIWLTKDNLLTYQKSTDAGKSWGSIYTDSVPGIQSGFEPKIFAFKRQIFIIWTADGCLYRLSSAGNGNNWGSIQKVIDKPARRITFPGGRGYVDNYDSISVANTPAKIISSQLYDSTLYIVYESFNWLGTFISKSYDFGVHWMKPVQLFPNEVCKEQIPFLSMFVDLRGLHLIYLNRLPASSSYYGMNYMFSTDKGDTWKSRGRICTLISDPENDCLIDSIDQLPIFVSSKDTLQIIYGADDIYRIISDDNGLTWSSPKRFGIDYPEEFTVYSDKNGKVIIPFISIKNRKNDLSAYLPSPLEYMISGDDGSEWDNNDLYILSMVDNDVNVKRITKRVTYVQNFNLTFIHSMKCVEVKNNILVFWAGKEMERKQALDPSNSKFQLFFSITQ